MHTTRPGLQHGYFGGALASAVARRALDAVKLLINAKADVNQRLQYGSYGSALAVAAAICEENCSEVLIQAGTDVNLNTEGRAPSSSALVATGSNISEADRWLLEMFGFEEDKLLDARGEMAPLLQEHGAEI